jgi:GT2 family glycosyltransferase
LRNRDGTFQVSHSPFPHLWLDWMILTGIGRLLHGPAYPSAAAATGSEPQRADWVGGACMLVRREAFEAVGGLDEGYFMYAEEMDFCYRLAARGWEVWYEPAAVAVHLGGGSAVKLGARSEAMLYASRVRFYRLHRGASQARLLAWMILAATGVKIAVHGAIRWATGGRRGRTVPPLSRVRAELRKA